MKKVFYFVFAILLIGNTQTASGQKDNYKVAAVGFYNFENLFDTADDPEKNDAEFLPEGDRAWTEKFYNEKLNNLAKVVSDIGVDLSPDGLAILGVSEVENRKVLEDFVKTEKVKDRNYQIIHYESPDKRGIDCALLYQEKYFKVESSRAIPLYIYSKKSNYRVYTRDVLLVSGDFDGERMHVMVNHWPSRSGGEKKSAPRRIAGGKLVRSVMDSIEAVEPNAKIIVMGDFNDDPINKSVRQALKAKKTKKEAEISGTYNAMWELYSKGFGTLAYRDAWSLFDQIILTKPLIEKDQDGYFHHKSMIYNERYLVTKNGQYKGYPFRTFAGSLYAGGYSDHYPVYIYLIKKIT